MSGSWRNQYLKDAQAISIYQRTLYVVSKGYDSILAFDLDAKRFFWALHVDLDAGEFKGAKYDPNGDKGPLLLNKLHLNSVHTNQHGMYIGGTRSKGMLHFNGESIYLLVTLPEGVHDAQPFRDGVLFNDSEAGAVRYASRSGAEDRAVEYPRYDTAKVQNEGIDDLRISRQGFGRGLYVVNDSVVATGSSPATISAHDLYESKTLLSVQLSNDCCNVIHSITEWPF